MKLAKFACVVLLSITARTANAQTPTATSASTTVSDRSVEDLFKAAQGLEGQNNFREAESFYEKIVREIEKEKVKNFPNLYRAYSGLANAELKIKDMTGADLNYREALSAAVKVYGAGSYDLTKPLLNLARVCYQEKKYFDSATYLKQALALVERKKGIEDAEAVSIREKLAETLERSGSYKESEVLLKQSLALREKSGDHNSPQLLALLNCYSDVLHKTDRVSEAEQIDYQVDQIHAGKIPASSTALPK